MNTAKTATPSPQGQQQLETLRRAVSKTLERKRRLGHYAVIWQDGKPVRIGDDAPDQPGEPVKETA